MRTRLIFKLLTPALLAATMLSSCSSDVAENGEGLAANSRLSVDKETVSLEQPGSTSVKVYATEKLGWTASTSDSWITIAPHSGEGNGNIDISVTEENPSTEKRTGTIHLESNRYKKTASIQVEQQGTYLRTTPDEEISLPAQGGTYTVSVATNATWQITGKPSWATTDVSGGAPSVESFSLTVGANSYSTSREGMLTVKNLATSKTIKLTQAGTNLTVKPGTLSFDAGGGSQNLTITSNNSWTVSSSDKTWCTVSSSSGNGDAQIFVKVNQNTSTTSRSANITIKSGNVSQTVKVTQEGVTLTVSPTSLSFANTSGSKTFTINSNTSWTVSSSQSWCTVSKTSGTNNTTITVNVTANSSTTSRSATITVKGGGITRTISVTQEPNVTLTVSPTSLSFANTSGSKTFTINSNTSWTVSSSQSWCTVSKTSGTNNTTITVNVTANSSTTSRSATITVKGGGITREISVSQNYTSVTLTVNKSSLSFTSSAGSNTFTITSNTSWTVSSSQSWCTVSKTSGTNNTTITVNVTANSSTTSRSATITVKGGGITREISVSQNYTSVTLTVNKSSLSFTSSAGSKTFTIASNTSWTVKSSDSWCTVSRTSGSNDATITVNVTANTGTTSRSATITVNGSGITRYISVIQSGRSSDTGSTITITVNGASFTMVRVEGGTFQMGSSDSDADSDEQPVHRVTLSSYYIGQTEVTQQLWQAVMGSNPSYFSGSSRPVERVSWNDCQEFIRKLNALTGRTFRLPTEAEWEFAARGGTKSGGYKYSGSDNIANVAWYSGNSGSTTHPVGQKSPNELGLYDLSGNVYEWCQDWFGSYSSSAQTNPTGPGSGSFRVNRGGSWGNFAWNCRPSSRGSLTPSYRDSNFLGLRLAL